MLEKYACKEVVLDLAAEVHFFIVTEPNSPNHRLLTTGKNEPVLLKGRWFIMDDSKYVWYTVINVQFQKLCVICEAMKSVLGPKYLTNKSSKEMQENVSEFELIFGMMQVIPSNRCLSRSKMSIYNVSESRCFLLTFYIYFHNL